VAEQLLGSAGSIHAPHLIDVEFAAGLRRQVLRRAVDPQAAGTVLDDFRALRLRRYPHPPLLERAWQLRQGLTISDGVYVALAEYLEAALVTTDAALGRTKGHGATIVAFGGRARGR